MRPLRIAHACFRSLAKPLAYRVPVYWGTSRLRVGSWCYRLGFIVIFLSSHSSLVRTGTSSAANITGWYKIKKERNVKTHIRQSSLRNTNERVLFGAPMPIFGIMRRLYQS